MLTWQKQIPKSRLLRKLLGMGINGLLILLWFWLFRPIYPYLGKVFGRQEFRLNQLLLLGALFLIVWQVRKGSFRPRLEQLPRLYFPALSLFVGAAMTFLVAQRVLQINTLSAALFGLGTYGMAGLWLRPTYWRGGFPAALLLIGALPFGDHLQTFIGYPVRLMTATVVREGLAALGVSAIGMDTILIFENSLSKVDLPCSGVKSLWTGGMFLLASTWIERRRINLRWMAIAILFVVLLLAANLARVAVLVIVGQVAGWRLLAEMLHVPLGVLGFAGACLAVVALLRKQGASAMHSNPETPEESYETATGPSRPAWLHGILAGSLAGVLAIIVYFYPPSLQAAVAQSLPELQLDQELHAEIWQLPAPILEWLSLDGPVTAQRWRFTWRGETGSILMVANQDWRTSHHPERCFQAYGMNIRGQTTRLIAPDFPLNLLSLQAGQAGAELSAVYWLQSGNRVTEDYATRIWAEITPDNQPWVQVTVLFDRIIEPDSPDIIALFAALRQSVQRSLEGVSKP